MVKIRRGARLYYTLIGHKGFHYPSNDNSYQLAEECMVPHLNWVETDPTKIAVIVTLPDDPARVMWVSKSDLLG